MPLAERIKLLVHDGRQMATSPPRMAVYKSTTEFLQSKNSKFKNWHPFQFLNRIDEPQRAERIKLLVNDGELKIRFGF